MGYDMHLVRTPEDEADRVAKLRLAYLAARDGRDAMPVEERGAFTGEEIDNYAPGDLPANSSDRFRAAQRAVDELAGELATARRSYFRLDLHTMPRCHDAMLRAGMAHDSVPPGEWPPWRRYPDDTARQVQFETVVEHLEQGAELPHGVPDEVLATAREHVARITALLRDHGPGPAGIPLHKVGSNDGWVITPDELTAALHVWDELPTQWRQAISAEAGEWWSGWIDYLRLAVHHGGIEVH